MQFIQPKRSKYKKCTKNYVQDNLLDIIDIEETLLKNRFITKVQKSDFLYAKFLPKNEALKPLPQPKTIPMKSLSIEKIMPVKDKKISIEDNKLPIININNKDKEKDKEKEKDKDKDNKSNKDKNDQTKSSLYNPDNINYDLLNKNKFDINFKKLKLEYKNGYKVLFIKEYYPIEIIGAGSFGLVVNVVEIKNGKKMAVKIINKNNVNYYTDADYLNNEVHILNSLDNPRIMKIYDILDNHHYFFIFVLFCAFYGVVWLCFCTFIYIFFTLLSVMTNHAVNTARSSSGQLTGKTANRNATCTCSSCSVSFMLSLRALRLLLPSLSSFRHAE